MLSPFWAEFGLFYPFLAYPNPTRTYLCVPSCWISPPGTPEWGWRMHAELLGSPGAAAGGQMLCPTVLPKPWGQFNFLPQAFLGLVPIFHVSSELFSLSHLPVSWLDLASVTHPHGSSQIWLTQL